MGPFTVRSGTAIQNGQIQDPEWTESRSRMDRFRMQSGPIQDAESDAFVLSARICVDVPALPFVVPRFSFL